MSSILTNSAAMVALQNLASTASELETTEGRISTGLAVESASDNAAYWSIATTMRADQKSLSAVEDSLGLGAAVLDVTNTAMESAIDIVTEIQSKITSASGENVDRETIQEDITELQNQLRTIASSASFNSENWLQSDTSTSTYNAVKSIVSGFTRDSDGAVSVDSISVDTSAMLLVDNGYTATKGSVTTTTDSTTGATTGTLTASSTTTGTGGIFDTLTDLAYTWTDDDDTAESSSYLTGVSVLNIDISDYEDTEEDSGKMSAISTFLDDVLDSLETAASQLGSSETRVELQQTFISELSDAIDRGIGQLVDADMDEESTRLKALQTQQQLGIQALQVSNATSQNILKLFQG